MSLATCWLPLTVWWLASSQVRVRVSRALCTIVELSVAATLRHYLMGWLIVYWRTDISRGLWFPQTRQVHNIKMHLICSVWLCGLYGSYSMYETAAFTMWCNVSLQLFLFQLLRGLSYCHSRHILHRWVSFITLSLLTITNILCFCFSMLFCTLAIWCLWRVWLKPSEDDENVMWLCWWFRA